MTTARANAIEELRKSARHIRARAIDADAMPTAGELSKVRKLRELEDVLAFALMYVTAVDELLDGDERQDKETHAHHHHP